MIGLKLVAWDYRHDSTRKDAGDLGLLLDATHYGPFADALWSDEAACEKWGYDDMLVGPYRAGHKLATTWHPASCERLRHILRESSRAELSAQTARPSLRPSDLRMEQLTALREGLADGATQRSASTAGLSPQP